jgi:hypothetical protein
MDAITYDHEREVSRRRSENRSELQKKRSKQPE